MLARLILAGLLLALPAAAQEVGDVIEGRAEVVDGDTIRLAGQRVRLYGIAAIERRNPLGAETADVLRRMAAGHFIRCEVIDIDRYDRPVGRCYAGDLDLSAEMVRRGWAANYSRFTDAYEALEREARDECRGVWAALCH